MYTAGARRLCMHPLSLKRSSVPIVALVLGLLVPVTSAQQAPQAGDPPQLGAPAKDTLADGPQVFTSTVQKFRMVPIKGLDRPFSLVFLPDGNMLITERAGRLRIVKNGVVDPQPISGIPSVLDLRLNGLQDLALHPRYAENKLVYFTYYKPKPGEKDVATAVLARGRFDNNHALTDVGKVLRLNDDGTIPSDNPFAGKPGYKPEIYALGIRNSLGLVIHPQTGELWEHENGPMGGDEINIIKPGRNYGWPIISYGRAYNGDLTGDTSGPTSEQHQMPGMEEPFLIWLPSIAPSGLAFYTGDQLPAWKGNIFVGGMRGMVLQRIVLNAKGMPILRENLLTEIKQRIRDVRQGPDGLLYLLTDETKGALLRLEPVDGERSSAK